EMAAAHVGEGLIVEDMVAMAGAQQAEKVGAAFRAGGGEKGGLRPNRRNCSPSLYIRVLPVDTALLEQTFGAINPSRSH
ncbi:MAG: hypothetical protein WCO00_18715, partial [Rhodospirillaceae bacterium]